jgi:hypothetical protein
MRKVEGQTGLALGHIPADLVQVEVVGTFRHLRGERAGGRGRVGHLGVAAKQLASDDAGAGNADAGARQVAQQAAARGVVEVGHGGLLRRGRHEHLRAASGSAGNTLGAS